MSSVMASSLSNGFEGDYLGLNHSPPQFTPSSYELNGYKRTRSGSISRRMRSASDLEERGLIDRSQKGALKDLIVRGDQQLLNALDQAIEGDPSELQRLIRSGALDEAAALAALDVDTLMDDLEFNFLHLQSADAAQGGRAMGRAATGEEESPRPPAAGAAGGYQFDLDEMPFEASFGEEALLSKVGYAYGTSPFGGDGLEVGFPSLIHVKEEPSAEEEEDEAAVGEQDAAQQQAEVGAPKAQAQPPPPLPTKPEPVMSMTMAMPPPEVAVSVPAPEPPHSQQQPPPQPHVETQQAPAQLPPPEVFIKPEVPLASQPAPSPLLQVKLEDPSSLVPAGMGPAPELPGDLTPVNLARSASIDIPKAKPAVSPMAGMGPAPPLPATLRLPSPTAAAGGVMPPPPPLQAPAPMGLVHPAPPMSPEMLCKPNLNLVPKPEAPSFAAPAGSVSVPPLGSPTASSRPVAVPSPKPTVTQPVHVVKPPNPDGKHYVGAYSPESRRRRLERFWEKKKNRIWQRKVKYDVRKEFAESRIRVKGRFVKKEDEAILTSLLGVVVPPPLEFVPGL